MFKLSKLNDNLYAVYGKGFSVEGSKIDIIQEMLRSGVDEEDIALGLEAVEQYDFADYGIDRTFIIGCNFKRVG